MMIHTKHRQAVDLTVLVFLNSRFRLEKYRLFYYFLRMVVVSLLET